MKTITKTSFANLKLNKGRNILTGVAIALTTILIYTILTIGFGTIKLEKEAINQIYPTWHIMYFNLKESTVQAITKHARVEELGVRADIARTEILNNTIYFIYMDKVGCELNKMKLAEGIMPVKADDIVLSKETMEAVGQEGNIGDYIELPYQILETDGMSMERKGRFRICGILPDGDSNTVKKSYGILVSGAFMQEQVPIDDQRYRIMLRLDDAEHMTTDEIEDMGYDIAEVFGIAEGDVFTNNDYLWANYVDPSFYSGIIAIILVVVLAGVLTIYSIYYVSMIHKIQEYGKLKALGATRRQIRQIVFREGMFVTCLAVPLGLIIAIVLSRSCFQFFTETMSDTNSFSRVMVNLLKEGKVSLLQPWVVMVSVGISFLTVSLSLLKPMMTAGKISAIEAIRYENGPKLKRKIRTGYTNLTLLRLTKTNLSRNKSRTAITVITLGITGVLFIVVATVLSCAKPSEIAREEILADYRISIDSESGNQMHPERDWKNIQQNNPLNATFEQQVLQIEGVKKVQKMQLVSIQLEDYTYNEEPWYDSITGLDEEFREVIEDSQIDGRVSYEELLNGEKILLSKNFLYWFPDIDVGDRISITMENGDDTIQKEFVIGAICDLSYAITQGSSFLIPTKVIENLCSNNMTYRYEVTAVNNNEDIKVNLDVLVDSMEFLELESYQDKVKLWESTMGMMSKAGYVFIIILAGVGIMNLINTMINSVYIRKKELGIMQAIGMSDRQLLQMLQLEGLFYTLGTLVISLGIGNIAGYGVFLYAKENGMLNITKYHYPLIQTVLMVLTVFLIQMLLSILISRSLKKQSLIERVRFSE